MKTYFPLLGVLIVLQIVVSIACFVGMSAVPHTDTKMNLGLLVFMTSVGLLTGSLLRIDSPKNPDPNPRPIWFFIWLMSILFVTNTMLASVNVGMGIYFLLSCDVGWMQTICGFVFAGLCYINWKLYRQAHARYAREESIIQ